MTEKDLQKFQESLKDKTLEELEKLEQEVIAEADKDGENLGKIEFDLPLENYEEVAKGIRMFLNKQTVQWQYTLGLVSMYDFWDPAKHQDKIPYPHLDSVLRTLGQLQYTGYDEWVAVVAINKFFEPLHKAYMEATQNTYDIACRHDAIMKEIEAKTPIGKPESETTAK